MIGFGVFTLFSIYMDIAMSVNSGGQGQGDGNVALRCIGNVKARVSSGNHKCLLPCIQRRRRNEVVFVLSARERLSFRGQLYGVREYHRFTKHYQIGVIDKYLHRPLVECHRLRQSRC